MYYPCFWGIRGLNWLLKEIFERPRPEWSQLVDASHYSFPSGHAMNSSAFFVGLLCLVFIYTRTQSVRIIASLCLILLILLVGFSRMYLGVHYLTDILAGYALGISWALSMYQLYNKLMYSSLKRYQFPT
ncbi:phosphatase PAP2 family protein [Priestia flexa]